MQMLRENLYSAICIAIRAEEEANRRMSTHAMESAFLAMMREVKQAIERGEQITVK